MEGNIDVLVTGAGRIRGGEVERDAGVKATCSLCGSDSEATAVLGKGDEAACAACLRKRLDALSVARFRLLDGSRPSPWGKVSG